MNLYMNMDNTNRGEMMDNLEMFKQIAVKAYDAKTDEEVNDIVKMLIRLFIG